MIPAGATSPHTHERTPTYAMTLRTRAALSNNEVVDATYLVRGILMQWKVFFQIKVPRPEDELRRDLFVRRCMVAPVLKPNIFDARLTLPIREALSVRTEGF